MSAHDLHPNEVSELTGVQLQLRALRAVVGVKRLVPEVCLPVADWVPNAWSLRANDQFTVPGRSTYNVNLGIQFYIPKGIVGVISEHPYNHGQNPYTEVVHLHEHLPHHGVTLRLTNNMSTGVHVGEGDFLGLLHFYRSLAVEWMVRPSPGRRGRTPSTSSDEGAFLRGEQTALMSSLGVQAVTQEIAEMDVSREERFYGLSPRLSHEPAPRLPNGPTAGSRPVA